MLHNTDTATGVVATSAPSLAYVFWRYLLEMPVEKWAATATFVFVALQITFLLVDRLAKRRGKRGSK